SEKHPGLAPPRVMLANLYISNRQKTSGLQQLELAVVESPADPEAHLIFGDIAIFEGRPSDAEAQYKTGAALLTNYNADAQRKEKLTSQCELGLANVEKLRGRWDAVQKQLNHLIAAQPQNATAHQRMAEAFIAIDKPDEALKQFQAAVKADPKLRPAPLLMAEVYRQIGKSSEVLKWLLRASQDAPGDVRTRLAMGDWWLGAGDYQKAATEFAAAEKIAPNSLDVRISLGMAARYQRDFTKARRYLDAALEQSPGNFAASNQLALVIADQADKPDPSKLLPALEIAQSNLKSAPNSAEAESTLGWVLYRMGNLDEAERHLRAVMSSGSVSRDTAFYIAKLKSDRGQRSEALTLLRRAIESKGPFAHADEAARWLAQQDRSSEAPKK
ncbi:MAG TPA: tetratricopeptide repeat protein, partial [Pirellulales bacterium]|nr:tetratricopeptide repeat protein [Pirellulales bacterium]